MKQSIIIVDDFYSNPDEIRNIALSVKYPEPDDTYTYPGRNSKGEYYNNEIQQRFENLTKSKLSPSNPNGYFRISLETDTHKQDVHVDPGWDWGAVVYLTDPKDCVDEGGTSFWRHNTLHMDTCPKTDEEAQLYGYPSYKESWWTTVYGDGLDRSKWTRYMLCPMKYNRLVLFKTHLWHSHNFNFGNDLTNGRLIQLFFFKEENNV